MKSLTVSCFRMRNYYRPVFSPVVLKNFFVAVLKLVGLLIVRVIHVYAANIEFTGVICFRKIISIF